MLRDTWYGRNMVGGLKNAVYLFIITGIKDTMGVGRS